ncbi:MAG TPA: pyridoxamine 5'-phosphate oxidase family protein [Mycobacterium sp.]|nr:pyridoxamine 5'-phosphate oxidase family protein [Mycobacterium sp.]
MASEPVQVELGERECRALLVGQQIGRLAITADLFPLIFVVNHGLDGDDVVIRTHPGTLLDNVRQTRVSFEVDEIDYTRRCGWSVLLRAIAERVDRAEQPRVMQRMRDHPVEPWAPGEHGHWVRLTPLLITGRRIVPGTLPPPFPDAADL